MKKKICSSVTGAHDGTEYDRMRRRKYRYYCSTGRDQGRGNNSSRSQGRVKGRSKGSEAAEKAPEDYSGTVVVYSPHDADPLNAGVNLFMEKYPNVKVEVVAAGTGELW